MAAAITNLITANNCTSVDIKTDHISSGHQAEVLAKGIHPHVIFEFGIPDTDMTGHTLSEAFAGKIPKDAGGMYQDMLPVFAMTGKFWNSYT
jgi:hypothetical protein